MLSLSNIFCDQTAGNERLRYGHRSADHAQQAPRPVVVWAVTRACNLRCVHCYASACAKPDPNELSHAEGRSLLEELAAYGVPAVLFSGGEPLARPDTLDLIAYARQLGLACTLSSNGTLLDHHTAHRLAATGLKYVGLSLDGIGPDHDVIRGQRGCFDQTLNALRQCRSVGLKTGLRFTIHALNLHHLDAIIDLALAERVNRLCVYHLAYAGRGNRLQRVDLTHDQTRRAIEHLIERTCQAKHDGHDLEVLTVGNHADAAFAVLKLAEQDPGRARDAADRLARTGGNRSGQNICSIDAVGNVHYDQFSWHYSVGNIRQATFAELWGNDTPDRRLRQLRQRPEGLPTRCRGCRFLGFCNGNLRTRAESATGDWLGLDPACYLTDQQIAPETTPDPSQELCPA